VQQVIKAALPDPTGLPEVDVTYELSISPSFLDGREVPLVNTYVESIDYVDGDLAGYQAAKASVIIQIFSPAKAESNEDASAIAKINCQLISSRVRQILMADVNVDLLPLEITASRKVEKVEFSMVPEGPTDVRVAVAEMEFTFKTEETPIDPEIFDEVKTIVSNINGGIQFENKY